MFKANILMFCNFVNIFHVYQINLLFTKQNYLLLSSIDTVI